MKKEWTEQDLHQLVQNAQAAFEAASVRELDPDRTRGWQDDGLQVDYELRGGQVHCVMSRCVEADGKCWELRMTAPLAGNILPEERMTDRERELCHDDMNHDFLSGVYNRQYLETSFRASLDRMAGEGRNVAVALVSLDREDELRRDYGQPVMDQVICFMANQWKKHFDQPNSRVVCRLNSTVFVVGCVDCTEKQLEDEMRTLHAAMPRECISSVNCIQRVPYTMTVACAGIEEVAEKNWETLYALCDKRLKAAAAAGGNCVAAANGATA
ncbi:MAG: GGDEF domain-containing protein [Faecalibacterium sp.]